MFEVVHISPLIFENNQLPPLCLRNEQKPLIYYFFSVKFSKRFLKKLLVMHHKKEKKKKLRISFFFLDCICSCCDFIEFNWKNNEFEVFATKIRLIKEEVNWFQRKRYTVNLPNIFLFLLWSKDSCCGVVVITLVLHTKGPQFDPGQQHFPYVFILWRICHL